MRLHESGTAGDLIDDQFGGVSFHGQAQREANDEREIPDSFVDRWMPIAMPMARVELSCLRMTEMIVL